MANRIPLIVNAGANQIQELPAGDSLNGIVNVTATGTIQAEQITSTDDLTVNGKIQPSFGSGAGDGIRWAENAHGIGSGDFASITYFSESGEDTKLKIATGNDPSDDIELETAMGAAVNISASTTSSDKTTGALVVTGGVGIGGALNVGGDITAFATSDVTLKENITPISNAVDKVRSISGNTFTWNEKSVYNGEEGTGIIAQEIEALGLPGVTETREDGTKAVRYDRLVPLLIEAIKELDGKVKSLEG